MGESISTGKGGKRSGGNGRRSQGGKGLRERGRLRQKKAPSLAGSNARKANSVANSRQSKRRGEESEDGNWIGLGR